MGPYVMAKDLYQFKLALILGRGKRLKRVLKNYPTERKFKKAPLSEIAEVVGIKDLNSSTLRKLKELDNTYDQMVTFKPGKQWSRKPTAEKVMGVDTEYLKSDLDSIQYVIISKENLITSGFIFTNEMLAPSVSKIKGIKLLKAIIKDYEPDLIVGHNFNSDITVLESVFNDSLPELYCYDDTMDLLEDSNLANIIGGFSLNKAVKEVFHGDVIGLFSAYNQLELFIEYGIKDAIYPILLRDYILNGTLKRSAINLKLEKIIKEENRSLLKTDTFKLSFN